MKFSIKMPGLALYPAGVKHWWEDITPEQVRRAAKRIDELGFDWVFISDHIVLDRAFAKEMGNRWVHSLTAAGVVLGATRRIKVMPLVVVPYHNPLECAKMISTLDFLSGGRVTPLLLLGYQRAEFEALGVRFEARAEILDEYVRAMLELWESDSPSFEGAHVRFSDLVFEPKPAQQPVPVQLGGSSPAALRRVARYGHGWNTSTYTPRSQFRKSVDYICSQPAFQENPRPLELSLPMFEGTRDLATHRVVEQAKISFDPDSVLEEISSIAALGATYTEADDLLGLGRFQNTSPSAPPHVRSFSEFLERLEWFQEHVMQPARGIVPASAPFASQSEGAK